MIVSSNSISICSDSPSPSPSLPRHSHLDLEMNVSAPTVILKSQISDSMSLPPCLDADVDESNSSPKSLSTKSTDSSLIGTLTVGKDSDQTAVERIRSMSDFVPVTLDITMDKQQTYDGLNDYDTQACESYRLRPRFQSESWSNLAPTSEAYETRSDSMLLNTNHNNNIAAKNQKLNLNQNISSQSLTRLEDSPKVFQYNHNSSSKPRSNSEPASQPAQKNANNQSDSKSDSAEVFGTTVSDINNNHKSHCTDNSQNESSESDLRQLSQDNFDILRVNSISDLITMSQTNNKFQFQQNQRIQDLRSDNFRSGNTTGVNSTGYVTGNATANVSAYNTPHLLTRNVSTLNNGVMSTLSQSGYNTPHHHQNLLHSTNSMSGYNTQHQNLLNSTGTANVTGYNTPRCHRGSSQSLSTNLSSNPNTTNSNVNLSSNLSILSAVANKLKFSQQFQSQQQAQQLQGLPEDSDANGDNHTKGDESLNNIWSNVMQLRTEIEKKNSSTQASTPVVIDNHIISRTSEIQNINFNKFDLNDIKTKSKPKVHQHLNEHQLQVHQLNGNSMEAPMPLMENLQLFKATKENTVFSRMRRRKTRAEKELDLALGSEKSSSARNESLENVSACNPDRLSSTEDHDHVRRSQVHVVESDNHNHSDRRSHVSRIHSSNIINQSTITDLQSKLNDMVKDTSVPSVVTVSTTAGTTIDSDTSSNNIIGDNANLNIKPVSAKPSIDSNNGFSNSFINHDNIINKLNSLLIRRSESQPELPYDNVEDQISESAVTDSVLESGRPGNFTLFDDQYCSQSMPEIVSKLDIASLNEISTLSPAVLDGLDLLQVKKPMKFDTGLNSSNSVCNDDDEDRDLDDDDDDDMTSVIDENDGTVQKDADGNDIDNDQDHDDDDDTAQKPKRRSRKRGRGSRKKGLTLNIKHLLDKHGAEFLMDPEKISSLPIMSKSEMCSSRWGSDQLDYSMVPIECDHGFNKGKKGKKKNNGANLNNNINTNGLNFTGDMMIGHNGPGSENFDMMPSIVPYHYENDMLIKNGSCYSGPDFTQNQTFNQSSINIGLEFNLDVCHATDSDMNHNFDNSESMNMALPPPLPSIMSPMTNQRMIGNRQTSIPRKTNNHLMSPKTKVNRRKSPLIFGNYGTVEQDNDDHDSDVGFDVDTTLPNRLRNF